MGEVASVVLEDDADRGEHRVKAVGELAVPVADEEPETLVGVVEVGSEVPCDLGHPWAVWVGGDTEDVDDASLQLDHEQQGYLPTDRS